MLWGAIEHTEELKKMGCRRELSVGATLDLKNHIFFLEKGICALGTVTPEGNERTYLYFKSGDFVGFLRHLLPAEKYPNSHIAKTDNRVYARTEATIYLIERDCFVQEMKDRPWVNNILNIALAQNLVNLIEHSALVSCESAPIRICSMLLEFAEERDGRLMVPKCFTQEEMSNFLSVHKITVSKVLKQLRHLDYIQREGRSIEIVQREKLQEVVDRVHTIQY